MMNYNNQNTSLTFGEIILGQVKIISQLSNTHLKNDERIIQIENSKQIIETSDSRIAYIQSVENLALILHPYFDTKMKEVYKDNLTYLRGFSFQIKKLITEKDLKEHLDNLEEEDKGDFIVEVQLIHAKDIFIELSELLKRVDYLKSSVFGDNLEELDLQGGD